MGIKAIAKLAPVHVVYTISAGEAADTGIFVADQDYQIMRFAPARLNLRPGDGPPHIRLDRAAEFLIGDRL